jgi:hypothetical protein
VLVEKAIIRLAARLGTGACAGFWEWQMIAAYRAVFSVAGLFFAVNVCAVGEPYTGDGQFIDHGSHRLTNRYEVILGTVNVGSGGKKDFRFRGLPHREFILGLRLGEANCKLEQSAIAVTFTVRNERGEVVIHEERLLRDLVSTRP